MCIDVCTAAFRARNSDRDRTKPITVTSRVVARESRVRDRKKRGEGGGEKRHNGSTVFFIIAKFVASPFMHRRVPVRDIAQKSKREKRAARSPFSRSASPSRGTRSIATDIRDGS